MAETYETVFESYLSEVQKCREGRCYWSLLHMLLAMPGICAAAQESNGSTSGKDQKCYEAWCEVNLIPLSKVKSKELWYHMRCKIFHQGWTSDCEKGDPKVRFYEKGQVEHASSDQGTLCMDVDEMADEIFAAVRKWWNSNHSPQLATRIEKIARPTTISIKLSGLQGTQCSSGVLVSQPPAHN